MELNIPSDFDYEQLQFTRHPKTNEITYNVTLVAEILSIDTVTEMEALDSMDV